jgi:hypothetical protein
MDQIMEAELPAEHSQVKLGSELIDSTTQRLIDLFTPPTIEIPIPFA